MLGHPVKSQVLDPSVVKENLEYVHQLSELREYQNFVPCADELGYYSI